MGGASGVAGGQLPPCALCPASPGYPPPSRRKKKLYVPSSPFPSIVAAFGSPSQSVVYGMESLIADNS